MDFWDAGQIGSILRYVEVKTVLRLSGVNRLWRSACQDEVTCRSVVCYDWKKMADNKVPHGGRGEMQTMTGWRVYNSGDSIKFFETEKKIDLVGMTSPISLPRADAFPLVWRQRCAGASSDELRLEDVVKKPGALKLNLSFTLANDQPFDVLLQNIVLDEDDLAILSANAEAQDDKGRKGGKKGYKSDDADQIKLSRGFGLRVGPTSVALLRLSSGEDPVPLWEANHDALRLMASPAVPSYHVEVLYNYTDVCVTAAFDTPIAPDESLTPLFEVPDNQRKPQKQQQPSDAAKKGGKGKRKGGGGKGKGGKR
eukprot:gene21888-33627_t